MLLNQMRCEDGNPENLLRNSFYQFQTDRALPDLEVCFTDLGHFCLFMKKLAASYMKYSISEISVTILREYTGSNYAKY